MEVQNQLHEQLLENNAESEDPERGSRFLQMCEYSLDTQKEDASAFPPLSKTRVSFYLPGFAVSLVIRETRRLDSGNLSDHSSKR
ncbi:hypothetical protein YC2023_062506 [Brassica napus]